MRSGALIFSSAIVEFSSTKGAQQAVELAQSSVGDSKLTGEFDIIVMNAEDFIAGKKFVRKNASKPSSGNMSSRDTTPDGESEEKKCRIQ